MNRWRALLWPGVATAIALAILLSLAGWQWQRRGEKEAILAALERGIGAPPVTLDYSSLDAAMEVIPPGQPPKAHWPELLRVQIEGEFLPDKSVAVRATLPATRGSTVSGVGFFWMTPIKTLGEKIVFINRGFVPSGPDFRPPQIPTPPGQQVVVGLLRRPEKRQFFMGPDRPERREFAARDPEAMAIALGLKTSLVMPIFVDAERAPGDATPPVGVDAREMIARIPNNHLQYAGTWFGLALTLVGVFAAFAVARLRGHR